MAYRETVLRFLSLQYGTTEGWAGLGIKTSSGEFSETWFPWPSEAEQMATAAVQEDSCGSDVWFCASVMREPKRAIGSSVARPRLHADIDRELTDEDAAKIEQLGAWVVYSGTPGHVHVYVELDEVVDVATYHSLENSLCAWLGADAKKRDNDLLRIPGLNNHKQQHPRAVMWDGSTGMRRWDTMELGALLPTVAYDAPENSSAAFTAEPVDIPEFIGSLLTTGPSEDRSAQAAKIINACTKAEFTEGETLYALVQDPVQRERFLQKPATVFGEIRKLRATYTPPTDSAAEMQADFDFLMGKVDGDGDPVVDLLPFMSVGELASMPPAEALIEGFLYKNTLAQIAGQPGSYKTFITLSWACAVAAPEDFGWWQGVPIKAHGPVIYIAAEGLSGIAVRIMAWCEENGVNRDDLKLYVVPDAVQMGNAIDMARLQHTIEHLGAVLVVFDTRARCTVGMEENSATEMGQAIWAIENVRLATGCTMLAVHHAAKAGGTGRGSSAWDGAVWTSMVVEKPEHLSAVVTCEKHKEISSGCKHEFEIALRQVRDESLVTPDLFARNTLVVRNSKNDSGISSGGESKVLDLYRKFAGTSGITKAQAVELSEGKPSKSTIYEMTNVLVKKGMLIERGSGNRTVCVVAAHVNSEVPESSK